MKIKIREEEIEIKQTFRTLMIYENIAKESFVKSGSMTSMILYFYCNVLACSKDCHIDFDEFLDYIDEHRDIFNEYVDWFAKQNKIEDKLKPIKKGEEKKRSKTKS